MNITKKLDTWNEALNKSNLHIKKVADHASGEFYFEVAKYNDDGSKISRLISKIKDATGVDMRFSFINLNRVIFTSGDFLEVEKFIENICKENTATICWTWKLKSVLRSHHLCGE